LARKRYCDKCCTEPQLSANALHRIGEKSFAVRSKMRALQQKIGSPVQIDLHKAHTDPLLDKIVPMDGSLDSMCVSKVLPPKEQAPERVPPQQVACTTRYSEAVPSALR
jgi:hypothetical protein